jgi:hypothetical protein
MGAPTRSFFYDLADYIHRHASITNAQMDELRRRRDILFKATATLRRREVGLANVERWLFVKYLMDLLWRVDEKPHTKIAGRIDGMYKTVLTWLNYYKSTASGMREAIATIVAIDNVDQIIDGEVKEWSKLANQMTGIRMGEDLKTKPLTAPQNAAWDVEEDTFFANKEGQILRILIYRAWSRAVADPNFDMIQSVARFSAEISTQSLRSLQRVKNMKDLYFGNFAPMIQQYDAIYANLRHGG